MRKIIPLIIILASFSSCYYDSVEVLYGVESCDTVAISFVDDIAPIMEAHCTSCHSGETPSAGLSLEAHADVSSSVLNTTANGLINRIERAEGESGAMPTSYKLTQCQIDQVKAWAGQGALNN